MLRSGTWDSLRGGRVVGRGDDTMQAHGQDCLDDTTDRQSVCWVRMRQMREGEGGDAAIRAAGDDPAQDGM